MVALNINKMTKKVRVSEKRQLKHLLSYESVLCGMHWMHLAYKRFASTRVFAKFSLHSRSDGGAEAGVAGRSSVLKPRCDLHDRVARPYTGDSFEF